MTEKQARFMLSVINGRMKACKLDLHPVKTRIVNFRGEATVKYPGKLDFLGFTIRLQLVKTKAGLKLMPTSVISKKSLDAIFKELRAMKIHKIRGDLIKVSRLLSSKIRGIMNYFCKFWTGHTNYLWHRLNGRLIKWVMWEKGLYSRAARKWLFDKYKEFPNLFPHWRLVHP